MTQIERFRSLVEESINENGANISTEIKAMLIAANENASDEEIENFMEWLGNNTIDTVQGIIAATKPGDNFAFLADTSWGELLDYYNAR